MIGQHRFLIRGAISELRSKVDRDTRLEYSYTTVRFKKQEPIKVDRSLRQKVSAIDM